MTTSSSTSNPIIPLFREYGVPVNESDFIDWYDTSNEAELILDELGIYHDGKRTTISTTVVGGEPNIYYAKLKLLLLSQLVNQ